MDRGRGVSGWRCRDKADRRSENRNAEKDAGNTHSHLSKVKKGNEKARIFLVSRAREEFNISAGGAVSPRG
jgi:hypothetical protein